MIIVSAANKVLMQHLTSKWNIDNGYPKEIKCLSLYYSFITHTFVFKLSADTDLYQYTIQTLEELDMFTLFISTFKDNPKMYNNNSMCELMSNHFKKPLMLTPTEIPPTPARRTTR